MELIHPLIGLWSKELVYKCFSFDPRSSKLTKNLEFFHMFLPFFVIMLYCVTLCYIMLYYVILCYIMLYHVILCHIMLNHVTLRYIWCVPKLGIIFGSPMEKKFFFKRTVQKKYGVVDENKTCSREIKQHTTKKYISFYVFVNYQG